MYDRVYIRGLTVDRDLARPGQRWAAALSWLHEGSPVLRHLVVRETAQDGAGQCPFDEYVLLQHNAFARWGAQGLEKKLARSQIIGGTVICIGMTLLEETMFDSTGRIANAIPS